MRERLIFNTVCNALAPRKQQAVSWNKDHPIRCSTYASPGFNELNYDFHYRWHIVNPVIYTMFSVDTRISVPEHKFNVGPMNLAIWE